jgi:hypothetical protein
MTRDAFFFQLSPAISNCPAVHGCKKGIFLYGGLSVAGLGPRVKNFPVAIRAELRWVESLLRQQQIGTKNPEQDGQNSEWPHDPFPLFFEKIRGHI